MKRAVFFDFDNTLLRGDSQGLEILDQIGRRWISPAFLARVALKTSRYRRGRRSSDDIVRLCLTRYRGWTPETIDRDAGDFFARVTYPRLRPFLLALVEEHRRRGDYLVLMSASPRHLVEPAGRFLRMDDIRTTILETDSFGRFTGRPLGPVLYGPHKKDYAELVARRCNCSLMECVAYSDHEADIELLESVGVPVAVCPQRGLAEMAAQRGWRILRD